MKKAQQVARNLIDLAVAAEIAAIKEIYDRLEGKAARAPASADTMPGEVIFHWKDSAT